MTVNRIAAWTASSLVGVALVAGLLLSGSPVEQRHKRLDERRVGDLQRLAAAIDGYWLAREALPESLGELVDGRRLSRMPSDPVTGLPYEYETTEQPTGYRLCATFQSAASEASAGEFWAHGPGRHCYTFEPPVAAEPALRRLR